MRRQRKDQRCDGVRIRSSGKGTEKGKTEQGSEENLGLKKHSS